MVRWILRKLGEEGQWEESEIMLVEMLLWAAGCIFGLFLFFCSDADKMYKFVTRVGYVILVFGPFVYLGWHIYKLYK